MSVTEPQGFAAAGITCGLKASGKPDLALVQNLGPSFAAAGVFTTNRVVAAPVVWSRETLEGNGGQARAVVLNSGNANAATGQAGWDDAVEMAERTAAALGLSREGVLVCSTGVIGEKMPMDTVRAGIDAAAGALSPEGGAGAAEAIITTDTHPKTAVVRREGYSVGGMVKGAGMLAPGLATMLCVITTDADVSGEELQEALNHAVEYTFNRLDSDGCMSTNDTVIVMASGASGVRPPAGEFTGALSEICRDLAHQLLSDAEGAAHDVHIRVYGARDEAGALFAARRISRSNLFKTAIAGEDPNWGRIISELGTCPAEIVPFDPARLDVSVNGVAVCKNGGLGEDRSQVQFQGRDVTVEINLKEGFAEASVWTNDLTHAYVSINSEYTT